jgi:hypothetical protein
MEIEILPKIQGSWQAGVIVGLPAIHEEQIYAVPVDKISGRLTLGTTRAGDKFLLVDFSISFWEELVFVFYKTIEIFDTVSVTYYRLIVVVLRLPKALSGKGIAQVPS